MKTRTQQIEELQKEWTQPRWEGAVHRSMDLRQRLRADLWPDGRCGDG